MTLSKNDQVLLEILLEIFKGEKGVINPNKFEIENSELKVITDSIRKNHLVEGKFEVVESGVPNKITHIGIKHCELTRVGGKALDKLSELNG
ncbi:hypothetical protein ETH98_06725 [Macrococcoides caseolyticum]|uniref:hypothetical protein n=1 Tax=Macrococcoides caseolyticum TaxID=69966 RepID=UPI00105C8E59|nr:hypothetical protein [Macrococcus caseolyticus]TDM29208.1 hypothetical protein ETH98_06725 [Macrococcus caseolyticus]